MLATLGCKMYDSIETLVLVEGNIDVLKYTKILKADLKPTAVKHFLEKHIMFQNDNPTCRLLTPGNSLYVSINNPTGTMSKLSTNIQNPSEPTKFAKFAKLTV